MHRFFFYFSKNISELFKSSRFPPLEQIFSDSFFRQPSQSFSLLCAFSYSPNQTISSICRSKEKKGGERNDYIFTMRGLLLQHEMKIFWFLSALKFLLNDYFSLFYLQYQSCGFFPKQSLMTTDVIDESFRKLLCTSSNRFSRKLFLWRFQSSFTFSFKC